MSTVAHTADRVQLVGGRKVRGRALGITTKSTASDARRGRRHRLYRLQAAARVLMPGERTSGCMTVLADGAGGVSVVKRPDGSAGYRGLVVCGSVWLCPVCAARIANERRAELAAAVAEARAQGLNVYLLTYTFRHRRPDRLKVILSGFGKALSALAAHRGYKELRDAYGVVGTVKALEVTVGANGWHPHAHVLLFAKYGATPEDLRARLLPLWAGALGKQGLGCDDEHGLDVRATSGAIADYVAKWGHEPTGVAWGPEHELALSHTKQGRAGGLSPFQLLDVYDESDGEEAMQAAALFQEYARAFKGRRQLVWSRGLRDVLGLGEEVADEDLTEDSPEDVEVYRFELADWRLVCRLGIRAAVLDAAEEGGGDAVHALLTRR